MNLRECVKHFEKKLHCNCDLDKWQPGANTGHSFVCRIHKHAMEMFRNRHRRLTRS